VEADTTKYFVYIVRCADGTFYTGFSTDVEKRVARHNEGRGAKYTRGRRPVVLVYRQRRADAYSAKAEERAIKRLTRAEKQRLIESQQNETYDTKRNAGG